MKKIAILIISFVISINFAKAQNDISSLNPNLQNLYHKMDQGLLKINSEYTFKLKLKFASEKAILFQDGYVKVDKETRYSFLKFKRNYVLPEGLTRGQNVYVQFKVIEVRSSATTPGMPYLFVELKGIIP